MTHFYQPDYPFLYSGDVVDVIATGTRSSAAELQKSIEMLKAWDVNPRISETLFGEALFYCNSDEARFKNLKNALYSEDSNVVWSLRGGCGTSRLLEELAVIEPPKKRKLLIGYSDVTALHSFVQEKWGWPSLHASTLNRMATGKINHESIELTRKIVCGRIGTLTYENLTPFNERAHVTAEISSCVVGGNLSVLQYGIGTPWELDTSGKIVFFEDVDERPYRTAERLEHLKNSGFFKDVQAVLIGDFNFFHEIPEAEIALYPKMFEQFANRLECPVLLCRGIGHTEVNRPLPLRSAAKLITGPDAKISFEVHNP